MLDGHEHRVGWDVFGIVSTGSFIQGAARLHVGQTTVRARVRA